MRPPSSLRLLAGVHSAYLVTTGVWPLVSRASFERVTGPKRDFWLVRTVGGLAAATGISLGVAAVTGRKRTETSALGLATGLVFTVASLRAAQTHSRIYLADVALETIFSLAWIRRWESRTQTSLDSLTGQRSDSAQSTPDRDPRTPGERLWRRS